nr:putative phage abortive infection protein [Salinivibrio sp. VYel6]
MARNRGFGYANNEASYHDLSHYFRILYHILKFIDEEDNSKGDKDFKKFKFYTNILRSFLNYKETMLLALNCAVNDSDYQFSNYKNLVEKYEMLEHMRIDEKWSGLVCFYDKCAFGKNPDIYSYYEKLGSDSSGND